MTSNPFISIIIATFNVKEHIEGLILSLNSQIFDNYEVLISDGGSTDGSAEYLNRNKIKNLTWSKSAPDNGIYYGLNSALEFANGKWIIMMGADDRFVNNEALMNFYLESHKLDESCNLIYTDLQIRSKNISRFKQYPAYPEFHKMYSGLPPLHHQTIIVKKQCLDLYGKFDTKYNIHADYELFCRIMSFETPKKLNLFLISYYDSGFSSNFSNLTRSVIEIIQIRRKYNQGKVGLRIFFPHLRLLFKKLIPYQQSYMINF